MGEVDGPGHARQVTPSLRRPSRVAAVVVVAAVFIAAVVSGIAYRPADSRGAGKAGHSDGSRPAHYHGGMSGFSLPAHSSASTSSTTPSTTADVPDLSQFVADLRPLGYRHDGGQTTTLGDITDGLSDADRQDAERFWKGLHFRAAYDDNWAKGQAEVGISVIEFAANGDALGYIDIERAEASHEAGVQPFLLPGVPGALGVVHPPSKNDPATVAVVEYASTTRVVVVDVVDPGASDDALRTQAELVAAVQHQHLH